MRQAGLGPHARGQCLQIGRATPRQTIAVPTPAPQITQHSETCERECDPASIHNHVHCMCVCVFYKHSIRLPSACGVYIPPDHELPSEVGTRQCFDHARQWVRGGGVGRGGHAVSAAGDDGAVPQVRGRGRSQPAADRGTAPHLWRRRRHGNAGLLRLRHRRRWAIFCGAQASSSPCSFFIDQQRKMLCWLYC